MAQGLLTYREPMDLTRLVDTGFVDRALRTIGEYRGR